VAVVVVASLCWLQGSCVGFLSKVYGVSGAGDLHACSQLAHPSGISDPGGFGVALGGAMLFDYGGEPRVR
jgi:hypothetical protein